MSGVRIVGTLLRQHAPLVAEVASDRMKAGALPEGVALTAILVRSVSRSEWQPLKTGQTGRVTERIAVTVRAESFREQELVIGLVRDACRGAIGAIAGADRVAVLTAGTGPDVRGPGNSFEKTQDFRVSFDG